MNYKRVATTIGGQDGAIHSGLLFRFNTLGVVRVYDLKELVGLKKPQFFQMPKWEFTLDGAEKIIPHSNSVSFGREYYCQGDEFPLLYSTVYNNCVNQKDPMLGTVLVYRLYREKGEFKSSLVQMIRVGFCEDTSLWKSYAVGEGKDIRPYGNFLVDPEKKILWAYVMRNKSHTTRFFAFPLPSLSQGEINPAFGIPQVVLQKEEILRSFDTPFSGCIQGGVFHKGKIYSVEGLKEHPEYVPALRIVNTETEREEEHVVLRPIGLQYEPEMIEFDGETCYFSNCEGGIYTLTF